MRILTAVNFILAALLCVGVSFSAAVMAGEKMPYEVQDGKVDGSVYLGWDIFHNTCHSCHGVDATGTEIAPNLVEKVAGMTAREFTTKVLTRYRIIAPSARITGDKMALKEAILAEVEKYERGQMGMLVMPAWQNNPTIRPHILDLYAYLRARSDGVLPMGRPQRLPD